MKLLTSPSRPLQSADSAPTATRSFSLLTALFLLDVHSAVYVWAGWWPSSLSSSSLFNPSYTCLLSSQPSSCWTSTPRSTSGPAGGPPLCPLVLYLTPPIHVFSPHSPLPVGRPLRGLRLGRLVALSRQRADRQRQHRLGPSSVQP